MVRSDSPPAVTSPFDRTYLYLGFESVVQVLPATSKESDNGNVTATNAVAPH